MAAQSVYHADSYSAAFAPNNNREIIVERTGSTQQPTTSILVTAAKMAVILLIVVTVLAFTRIALTNATVVTLIQVDSISSQIAQGRSSGVSLEMEQSVLSNSSAINSAVKRLGMAAPEEVGTIALTPDIVATDSNGTLSLAETVHNFVKSQG